MNEKHLGNLDSLYPARRKLVDSLLQLRVKELETLNAELLAALKLARSSLWSGGSSLDQIDAAISKAEASKNELGT